MTDEELRKIGALITELSTDNDGPIGELVSDRIWRYAHAVAEKELS
jgi:hypothetical protein